MVTYPLSPRLRAHGYTVQSNGMQERLAASPRGAAGLRAALYSVHRGQLRGNEA